MILTPLDILNKLLKSEPISIVRIGDGESICLDALRSIETLDLCVKAVLVRQMGYEPSLKDVKAIRSNLISCYENADIIGIPQHTQKTNSHWGKVLSNLEQYAPLHPKKYCSTDIGYDFLNAGYFNDLLQNRERLAYIGCRNLEAKLSKTYNIKTVSGYHTAPEAKFTSGYDGDVHYPTQFNKASRWMDVVCKPGDLLLVGAGVIGKIYCNWWRDRGGIAFDVGSIMDEWHGVITRGSERGLDKVNNDSKFKL